MTKMVIIVDLFCVIFMLALLVRELAKTNKILAEIKDKVK